MAGAIDVDVNVEDVTRKTRRTPQRSDTPPGVLPDKYAGGEYSCLPEAEVYYVI